MIPFPGESIGLYDAYTLPAGDQLYSELSMYGDGATATLGAGGHWRAWISDFGTFGTDYLEQSDIDVDVWWVLEVDSGSATVTAAEGKDQDYADDPAAPSTGVALGSHTLTVGTNLIPSTFGAADVTSDTPDWGAMVLDLQATAGSVVVRQVKLRVYPPGGALGAWVDQPGFSTAPASPAVVAAFVPRGGASVTASPPEAAWDAAAAATVDAAGGTGGAGPYATGSLNYGTTSLGGPVAASWFAPEVTPHIDVTTSIGGSTALVQTNPHGVVAVITGQNPDDANPIDGTLVDGVDYIRPPTQVAFDDPHLYVQQDGTASVEWLHAALTVAIAGSTPALTGPTVDVTYPSSSPVSGGSIVTDMVEGGVIASAAATDTLNPVPVSPSGRFLLARVSHSMTTTAPDWPTEYDGATGEFGPDCVYRVWLGTGTALDGTFQPMQTRVNLPAYRVWNPTAGVETRPRVRQLHRDDGQGMTPPRHFGGASRARTGRHFGYD